MERDKYGRTSFRLVAAKDGGTKAGGEKDNVICWKERRFGDSGNVAVSGQKQQFIGRKDRGDRTDSRQKRTLSTSGKADVPDGEQGRRLAMYLADKCRKTVAKRIFPVGLENCAAGIGQRMRRCWRF